jgi:hypothetical protein
MKYGTFRYGQKEYRASHSFQAMAAIPKKPATRIEYVIREAHGYLGTPDLRDEKARPGFWLELGAVGAEVTKPVLKAGDGDVIVGAFWIAQDHFYQLTDFHTVNTTVNRKEVVLRAVRGQDKSMALGVKVVAIIKKEVPEE